MTHPNLADNIYNRLPQYWRDADEDGSQADWIADVFVGGTRVGELIDVWVEGEAVDPAVCPPEYLRWLAWATCTTLVPTAPLREQFDAGSQRMPGTRAEIVRVLSAYAEHTVRVTPWYRGHRWLTAIEVDTDLAPELGTPIVTWEDLRACFPTPQDLIDFGTVEQTAELDLFYAKLVTVYADPVRPAGLQFAFRPRQVARPLQQVHSDIVALAYLDAEPLDMTWEVTS